MKHLAFWRDEAPLRVRSAWVRWWPWAQIRQLRTELTHYRRWLEEAEVRLGADSPLRDERTETGNPVGASTRRTT